MHPTNIIRSQEKHSFSDILNCPHPTERMCLVNLRLLRRVVLQILRHRRAQEARTNGIDMDPLRRIIEGNLLRQLRDSAFRCGVCRRIVVGHQSLHGGGVDDPASALLVGKKRLLQHLNDGVFAAQEDAFGIDGHSPVPIALTQLVYAVWLNVRRLYRYTGVGTEDVDSSKDFHAFGHGSLDIRCNSDIGLHECSFPIAMESADFRYGAFTFDTVVKVVGLSNCQHRRFVSQCHADTFPVCAFVRFLGESKRSTQQILAPSDASLRHIALPSPDEAPVTKAMRPSMRRDMAKMDLAEC